MNPANEIVSEARNNPFNVLVMEDESILARGFQTALSEEGFSADLAMTGADAIATLSRKDYDLIVADLRLPDMDGMEVIRRARSERPETRVVIVTGYGDVASALEAFQNGVSDYLFKPLTENEFLDAVREAIGKGENRTDKVPGKQDVIRALKSVDKTGVESQPAKPEKEPPENREAPEPECSGMPHLLHQNKLIALGRLAASIVHEINNPLSGILNYLRLMIRIIEKHDAISKGDTEKFIRYLRLVEEEVGRCSAIVSNLLAFSRKREVSYGEVNIPDLIEKCIMLARHKIELENLSVRTAVDPGTPFARGDFNQIQQCVINLIFNAIDAMDKGGTLTVGCGRDSSDNRVEIRVTDDGCGIAEEDRARIFDPFYTTKDEGKGLGLGLSTVCKIVEQHGGSIGVESEPGKGTTFTIRLPAMNPA